MERMVKRRRLVYNKKTTDLLETDIFERIQLRNLKGDKRYICHNMSLQPIISRNTDDEPKEITHMNQLYRGVLIYFRKDKYYVSEKPIKLDLSGARQEDDEALVSIDLNPPDLLKRKYKFLGTFDKFLNLSPFLKKEIDVIINVCIYRCGFNTNPYIFNGHLFF